MRRERDEEEVEEEEEREKEEEKEMMKQQEQGERLYPLVLELAGEEAGLVTGMLLTLDVQVLPQYM